MDTMDAQDKPLTTREVPPQFLKPAMLVGHIPHRALASDPRVSYALYVPPRYYWDGHDARANDSARAKLPLLVSVHGTRRYVYDIEELAPFAESTPCAILTPLFPTGLDGPNDVDSYKQLRSKTLRSDLAILSMLDEVAVRWPEIDTDKIFLMGFSGGGQFVHRFLYVHPERLAAASVGAPGHTTALDDQQNWPAGTKDVESLLGKPIDKDLIKRVAIQLVVGDQDVKIHGGEAFWTWVRQLKARGGAGSGAASNAEKYMSMDHGRLETMRKLRDSWERDGIEAQLDVVGGVAHDARGVRDAVLAFLEPRIKAHSSN
ncbi:alpha/beta-hydrolase [Hypoxylon sp. FL0543]|nr:alpha/beta-hydrolase [Hypoxylon sp. FL0543]